MAESRVRSELLLIGIALFISFVIWLIAKQGELEVDRLEIPVELVNESPTMKVTVVPQHVRIAVQYPVDLRNSIVPANFALRINAREVFREDPANWTTPEQLDVAYKVSEEMVRRPSLSQRVQVVDIDPEVVTLDAHLDTRRVKIVPQTVGELPSSLEPVGEIIATPAEVLVTGTADGFNRLAEAGNVIQTEPIDLNAITRSNRIFSTLQVPAGVRILQREDERVALDIAVEERSVQQIVTAVAIEVPIVSENIQAQIRPPTADVVLEGPPSALNRLSKEEIVLTPQRVLEERVGNRQQVGLEARFRQRVPIDVVQQVRIVETRPSRIEVEFVHPPEQNESGPGAEEPGQPATEPPVPAEDEESTD